MKKKLVLGALALSSTALFGLTGCGANSNIDTKPKYTVILKDNSESTEDIKIYLDKTEVDLNNNVIPEGYEFATDSEGFAGVWDSNIEWVGNTAIVTAKYGNGSEIKPYMIATAQQFKKVLVEYTKLQDTIYIAHNGTRTELETDAVSKTLRYKTVDICYTRANTDAKWTFSKYILNPVYFELVNDIDLAEMDLSDADLTGGYFCGGISGKNNTYTIKGLDGTKFLTTSGAMFDNVVSAKFKGLNIEVGERIGSLAGVARGAGVEFNNIRVSNASQTPTYITVDDTNESVFLHHGVDANNIKFKNCTNNANFVSSADYCGIFLGGYALRVGTLEFDNCVNYGTIKSAGSVGMLIGNGHNNPTNLIVNNNCKNLGTIASKQQSHVLVSHKTGTGLISQNVATYDTADYQKGIITNLESKYSATIDGDNIIVNKNAGENFATGKYQLILSAYASNNSEADGHMTLLTSITFTSSQFTSQQHSFNNVNYGIMDLNTFNAQTGRDIESGSNQVGWQSLEGYNIKYFVDITTKLFVVDFSEYEKDNNIEDNKLVINKTGEQLNKVVVVYDTNMSDIEFIVDFQ